MAFYENTIVAKQNLAQKELKDIKNKYNDIINNSSGKVMKIEEWGLISLKKKIKILTKDFSYTINLRVAKLQSEKLIKKLILTRL